MQVFADDLTGNMKQFMRTPQISNMHKMEFVMIIICTSIQRYAYS